MKAIEKAKYHRVSNVQLEDILKNENCGIECIEWNHTSTHAIAQDLIDAREVIDTLKKTKKALPFEQIKEWLISKSSNYKSEYIQASIIMLRELFGEKHTLAALEADKPASEDMDITDEIALDEHATSLIDEIRCQEGDLEGVDFMITEEEVRGKIFSFAEAYHAKLSSAERDENLKSFSEKLDGFKYAKELREHFGLVEVSPEPDFPRFESHSGITTDIGISESPDAENRLPKAPDA